LFVCLFVVGGLVLCGVLVRCRYFNQMDNYHGLVHVRMGTGGGQMGSITTAANAPEFFLHHCNIDRQWSMWQAKSPLHQAAGTNVGNALTGAPGYVTDAIAAPTRRGSAAGDIALRDNQTQQTRFCVVGCCACTHIAHRSVGRVARQGQNLTQPGSRMLFFFSLASHLQPPTFH
jgi:hypothetical protein